jgi:FAD/FMN-containing dehydrogenase
MGSIRRTTRRVRGPRRPGRGQDRVKASYLGNYGRLAQVKDRYDPDNTFHVNQNIQPASGRNP